MLNSFCMPTPGGIRFQGLTGACGACCVGDSKVSKAEFAALGGCAADFDMLDADGSGSIEGEELIASALEPKASPSMEPLVTRKKCGSIGFVKQDFNPMQLNSSESETEDGEDEKGKEKEEEIPQEVPGTLQATMRTLFDRYDQDDSKTINRQLTYILLISLMRVVLHVPCAAANQRWKI